MYILDIQRWKQIFLNICWYRVVDICGTISQCLAYVYSFGPRSLSLSVLFFYFCLFVELQYVEKYFILSWKGNDRKNSFIGSDFCFTKWKWKCWCFQAWELSVENGRKLSFCFFASNSNRREATNILCKVGRLLLSL
jgi:hypothetical protein